MSIAAFDMMIGILTGIFVGLPIAVMVLYPRKDNENQERPAQPAQPAPQMQIPQMPQPPIIIVHGAPYQQIEEHQPEQWFVADEPQRQITGGGR